jgi:hypothetical protein
MLTCRCAASRMGSGGSPGRASGAAGAMSMLAVLHLLVLAPSADAQVAPGLAASRTSTRTTAASRRLLAPGSQPIGEQASAPAGSGTTPHKVCWCPSDVLHHAGLRAAGSCRARISSCL